MRHFVKIFSACALVLLCSFAAEWVTVQNKPGRFKILFPRTPKESSGKLDAENGTLDTKELTYLGDTDKDDNSLYSVMYIDYQDNQVSSDFDNKALDKFFNKFIDLSFIDTKGRILSKKAISLSGYPGRKISYAFPNSSDRCISKIYLAKHRLYALLVIYDKKKEGNASIDKFFDSFELLP